MSTESNSNRPEEGELIIFLNYIGEKLSNLLNLIISLLKNIFSGIIYLLKTLFNSWKIILGVLILAYAIGYYMEKNRKPIYSTSMLVEPYFDSKYQLVTNINYFNALISNRDYEALGDIFKIDNETIDEVLSFKIEPGPETENERLLQYQTFKSKLDSIEAQDLPYEEFIENRSVYSGRYFLITASSTKDNIFKKLEGGIFDSFKNSYSKKIMGRDSLIIDIQRRTILQQLGRIDSLKTIYIDVIKEESKKVNRSISVGDAVFSSKKQETKEYDLLNKELALRNQLKDLEEKLIKKDDFFDVLTGFQEVGNVTYHWTQRYKLIIPVLAFILLCGLFLVKKLIDFTYSYEK